MSRLAIYQIALRYEKELTSIDHNSCCAPCQEAALVARLALGWGDKEKPIYGVLGSSRFTRAAHGEPHPMSKQTQPEFITELQEMRLFAQGGV